MKDSDLARILREHDYWTSEPYHIDAIGAYQQYGASEALMIAEAGLTRFPHDIALLVDALEWAPIISGSNRDAETLSAFQILETLKSLKERWTERAYEAVIKFYIKIVPSLKSSEDNVYLDAALKESQSYIDAFPGNEQSYLTAAKVNFFKMELLNYPDAHSEYTSELARFINSSIERLGPSKLTHSSIECARALMDEGRFEGAARMAKLGLQGCVASDAADDMEELLQLMLLSNDGTLMATMSKRDCFSPEIRERVERQIESYSEFLTVLSNDSPRARMIALRCCLYKLYLNRAIQ